MRHWYYRLINRDNSPVSGLKIRAGMADDCTLEEARAHIAQMNKMSHTFKYELVETEDVPFQRRFNLLSKALSD